MHEYCEFHTLKLLKCRKDMVAQKCFIPLSSNGAGNGTRRCDLLEEKRNDDTFKYFTFLVNVKANMIE